MCAPCTTFSKLWNFPASSSSFYFACTYLSVSTSTIRTVICLFNKSMLSVWSSPILVFSTSSYVIIYVAFSWSGSNWACLAYLFFCAVFSSICRFFISFIPFKLSVMIIYFCHFFKSCIATLTCPSFLSNCWCWHRGKPRVQLQEHTNKPYLLSLSTTPTR